MTISTALDRITAEAYKRFHYTSSKQHCPEDLSDKAFIEYRGRLEALLSSEIPNSSEAMAKILYRDFWNVGGLHPFEARDQEVQEKWRDHARWLMALVLSELRKAP